MENNTTYHLGNPSRKGVSRAAEKNPKDVHPAKERLGKRLASPRQVDVRENLSANSQEDSQRHTPAKERLDKKNLASGQENPHRVNQEPKRELETCNLLDNNPAKIGP